MRFKITLEKLNELNNSISIIDKGISVNTQNGYKKIKAIGVTSPNSEKIKILTKDFELVGSPSHRVKFKEDWFFLKDLKLGSFVNTVNGQQEIISISNDSNKEDLWDIEVDGEEYYSNGILSHNSSLITAFDYALYGKCRGNRKKSATLSTLPNRINGSDMLVSIDFMSGGTDVLINRGISPNVLTLQENGIENDRAGKSNISEKIEAHIGLDMETFKSFISMSVNDFKDFISLSNEEKQLLLDKLFNLEVINILNDILKDINKANKLQLTKFDSEISTLDDSIESIKRSIRNAIEKEKLNIQSEIETIKLEMDSKKEDYQKLKEKVDKIKAKDKEIKNELDREKEQFINIQNDIRAVDKDINLYNSGKCPVCQTDFDNDHFHNLKDILSEKKGKLEELKLEVESNIKLIKERQVKLQKMSDDTNTAFTDITYLLRSYKTQIDKLTTQKDRESGKSSPNIEEFERTIEELETKRVTSQEVSSICKDKELYYKELSKVFSEDGVKKTIISNIVKPINHFLMQNLRKMNLPFNVQLDDTFTANIKQLGETIEHDSLSTGEHRRLSLTILISYLMLIRTKHQINILFLDEIFSSIDLEGVDDILNLLKDFAVNYKINIFVVHHAIVSQEYFDRIIKINKDIFSTIEEVQYVLD